MAGKEDKDKGVQKTFDPDERFKYLGFEIHPGKIGNIFKSDSEKETWVEEVRQRRQKSTHVREHNTLEEARVTSFEKIVLTVTSVLLIASLFFPWFSGYREIEVESTPTATQQPMVGMTDSSMVQGMADSTMAGGMADSAAMAAGAAPMDSTSGAMATTEPQAQQDQTDAAGFSSIMATTKRKEIKRENHAISGLSAIASLGSYGGDIFSSGFILILTAILMLLYMLFCVGYAVYALYTLFASKGTEDVKALQLKRVLRLAWVPISVYVLCIILSVIGANYSFSTTNEMIKQIGSSYGTGTYLGLLSYGFYMTLACFALNGAKGVEI